MKIAIDISQLAYKNTGVANYLKNLVLELIKNDPNSEFVLFFSSLRGELDTEFLQDFNRPNVTIKKFKFPPAVLNVMWNKVHKVSIEKFIGPVDFVITSDWTEPPVSKARKGTILYDLIVFKYPDETAKKIVDTQKRKLEWVKKESDIVFCISESTKKDAMEILGLDKKKLKVIYPGLTL